MKEQENKWARWVEEQYDKDHTAANTDEVAMAELLNDVKGLPQVRMNKDRVFEAISSKIKQEEGPASTRSWMLWASGIAAVAIGIIFMFNVLSPGTTTYATQALAQKSFELPDGSLAHLNGSSSISFENKLGDKRHFKLEGEAFFEVKKGSTFTVETPNGFVQVLGTSFNVKTFEEDLIVACKTGKVRVFKDVSSVSYDLLPGDHIRLGSKIIQGEIEIDKINLWQEAAPYFTKAPLQEVAEAMADHYKIEIILDEEVADRPFTGTFVLDGLDKALKMVFLPMDVTYTLNDKSVRVQPK
jgi:transmembrane sensor